MREHSQATFFVGTSGWSYPDWRGRFYPADLPQKRWLEYYLTHFNAVEINATFYRKFTDQTYQKWYAHTPAEFRFVLKAPRTITHVKYLLDTDDEIREFDRSTDILAEKRGLILLQIAPQTPFDPIRLQRALSLFSSPPKVAVEFRHESWLTEEVYHLLQGFSAVLVNPDYPGHDLTDRLVSDVGYLRLHGRRRWYADDYTAADLAEIAGIAERMVERGAREVYIFFNNTVNGYAAHNAFALQAMLAS